MINLYYSNSVSNLFLTLAQEAGKSSRSNLWSPLIVAAPNSFIATRCQLAIAQEQGIAANIITKNDLKQLFSYLFTRDDGKIRLLNVNMTQQLILNCLCDEAWLVNTHELRQLVDYLQLTTSDKHETSHLELETKRFDLSKNLALLYQEYEQYRPEMLKGWLGRSCKLTLNDPQEEWQAAIYREIFRKGGRRDRLCKKQDVTWLRLTEILSKKGLVTDLLSQHPDHPGELHIFAILSCSELYMSLLKAIAASGITVNIYSFNPCREFWEDLSTGKKARLNTAPSELNCGPLALRLWGTAGRRYIALLNQLGDYAPLENYAPDTSPTTLLGHLQHDILSFQMPANEFSPDNSLTIQPAFYPRREVEEVLSHIGYCLLKAKKEKQSLRYNDFAIILPAGEQKQLYRQLLEALKHNEHLPLVYVGSHDIGSSQIFQAVQALMELPGSGFPRSALLTAMKNPFISRHFPNCETTQWKQWCEQLAIFHERDNQQGLYSWEQGCQRLLLGWFLPQDSQDKALEIYGKTYFAAKIGEAHKNDLCAFLLLVRSLVAQAESFQFINLNLAEWCEKTKNYLGAFICCQDEDEQRLYNRILAVLTKLSALSIEESRFNYELFRKLFLEELNNIHVDYHAPITEGIAVGELKDLRPCSFKHIYMLSMGNNIYPSKGGNLPFDLRSAHPEAGDIRPRQWQLYHFLELLCSGSETLELSYLAKDAVSGDDRQPSPLLDDLQFILAKGYLSKDDLKKITVATTADRHDSSNFSTTYSGQGPLLSQDAYEEARARSQYRPDRPENAPHPELYWPDHSNSLLPYNLPNRLTLTNLDLQRFLECPIQQYGRTITRENRYESQQFNDIEPLETDSWFRYCLNQTLFSAICSGKNAADLENIILEETTKAQYHGQTASGLILAQEQKKIINEWREKYDHITRQMGQYNLTSGQIKYYRFGQSANDFMPHAALEQLPPLIIPLIIEGHEHQVEITGTTHPFTDKNQALYFCPEGELKQFKQAMRATVDSALLLAGGYFTNLGGQLRLNEKNKNEAFCPLALNNKNEAQKWLTELLSAYFSNRHDLFLPCEAAYEMIKNHISKDQQLNPDSWARWWHDNIEIINRYNQISSDWGPIPQARNYAKGSDTATALQLRAVIKQRFAPMLGFRALYLKKSGA